jgi:hypothetical protein
MSSFVAPFKCRYCGEPVDPGDPHTMQRYEGWQQRAGTRESGKHGGSDMYMREPVRPEEFAHPACVRLARDGLFGQGALTL